MQSTFTPAAGIHGNRVCFFSDDAPINSSTHQLDCPSSCFVVGGHHHVWHMEELTDRLLILLIGSLECMLINHPTPKTICRLTHRCIHMHSRIQFRNCEYSLNFAYIRRYLYAISCNLYIRMYPQVFVNDQVLIARILVTADCKSVQAYKH